MSDPNLHKTYELIGRATVAWSRVELIWTMLFVSLLDAPREQADAIYHSLKSSAAQREMTLALAATVLSSHNDILVALGKINCSMGKLSGDRNAMMHAKYAGSDNGPTVDVFSVGQNRLVGKDLNAELPRIIEESNSLHDAIWTLLARVCAALGRDMPSLETPPPQKFRPSNRQRAPE